MFTVSSLGLMIRISPPDARGRVAGLFSSAFLVGSVGGPVLGSVHRGFGLAAPFVIYGTALLVAAAVVFFSLRDCTLAAPDESTEPAVSVREVLRHRAYRAALMSNFATGWAAFGLRIALVPLFVVEALGRGAGCRGFGVGDVRHRQRVGGHPQRLSVRPGRATQAAHHRADGVGGVDDPGRVHVVAAGVPGGGVRDRRGDRDFISPQQAAVADIVGSKARGGTAVATFQMMADLGSILGSLVVGQIAQHPSFGWAFIVSGGILLLAALGWMFAPETRVGRPSDPRRLGRWARRPAARCPDLRF